MTTDLGAAEPTSVSGTVVVGDLIKATVSHAFAYDLGAASPRLRDLGTLPATDNSSAVAVSDRIVVGNTSSGSCVSRSPCVVGHAFVYDLGLASPKMRDLGTLGGGKSSATAVSGKIVVGASTTAAGESHAFVYDLGAASPRMRDLGTLGGRVSNATAVSGQIVVGASTTAAGESHAFVYDLGAPVPQMRDLGTPEGSSRVFSLAATAVSGKIVVGTVAFQNPPYGHAFVYNLGDPSPRIRELGAPKSDLSSTFSYVTAVNGPIAVGLWRMGGSEHGVAWNVAKLDALPGS